MGLRINRLWKYNRGKLFGCFYYGFVLEGAENHLPL